ncbi:TPA: dATP/dGTP pyrophosphohydrolase domain-containing protein [Salmonella enterica]
MTTITKEWLQQTIAEFENTRDDIPFGLSDDDAKILIVLKRALASLEREQVRHEHAEWSDATFGDVGPVGPLKHLSKEALEAAADPSDPLEWADMQFLLWDAQRRMGISDEFITRAMIEKLEINKSRQWPDPKDGEPRPHIKEQPAPVVPEEMPKGLAGQIVSLLPCPFCGSPAEHYPDGDMEGHIIMCGNKNGDCNLQAFGFTTPEEAEKAWNTRDALLQGAEPVSQTYNLPELIEGMEVSIDVSTCDADAGNRYFGTVTEVSELDTAKNGYILLVQDAEPNFKTAGNSPVIQEGWTGSDEANAALIMLDRIETVDSVDDDRIEGIKRIIRGLAAAPQQ